MLKDGSLLVVFRVDGGDGTPDEPHKPYMSARSTDGGKTWSDVVFLAGSNSTHVGNPAAVWDSVRNRIVLIYAYIPYFKTSGIVFSSDDGQTFSDPAVADLGAANGSLHGPGTALQADTGRLLVASHHGPYDKDFVSYSDDGGSSWTTLKQVFPAMDEAAITQLPNGSLLLAMRHKNTTVLGRAFAVSDDGGASFGPIRYDAALKSPVCQASVVSFGGATYFSSPTCRPDCARANLTIFRSTDDAASWGSQLLVSAPASAGYSCLVKGALRGTPSVGGVLYEAAPQIVIDFSRFPLGF